MAGSVNKVILIGNLGRDPEIRSFPNGGRVCNLAVATSERWRDKQSGDQREKTEWHRVAIYNENLVGLAERYPAQGLQGLSRRPARNPQMAGPVGSGPLYHRDRVAPVPRRDDLPRQPGGRSARAAGAIPATAIRAGWKTAPARLSAAAAAAAWTTISRSEPSGPFSAARPRTRPAARRCAAPGRPPPEARPRRSPPPARARRRSSPVPSRRGARTSR